LSRFGAPSRVLVSRPGRRRDHAQQAHAGHQADSHGGEHSDDDTGQATQDQRRASDTPPALTAKHVSATSMPAQ